DDFDGGKLLGEHAMDADSVFYEGACYYDKEAARLSVRLPGRADPDELGVQVPEFNHGVVLADSQYIILDGLTIRHYGVGHDERDSYGIKVRRSSNCVVRNCVIYGVNYGIRYHDWPQPRNVDGYDNNTFERNDIYDVGPAGVSWQFYKATPPDFECATIQCQLGRGTVIRHNKLHGSFGGVKNGSLGDGNVHHPRLSGADMDVYGNEFYDLRDDGVEPDGSCNNVRIWHNAFYGVNQAISNCPSTMGPAYVVRNVFLGRPDMLVRPYSFLKFSAAEDSQGTTFVYHNTFFNARRSGEFTAALARSTDGRYFRLRNNVLVVRGVPDHTEIAQLLQREHHDFDYDLLYKDRVGEKENFDPFLQIAGANGKNMYLYDLQGMRSELGWEMHGVEADPQFVGGANPMSAADLHLTEGSPAVDAGLWIPNISDGWGGVRGAGPDMGAFEWPDE
ncbi:right-handed parallel beta-helix repeat-containing protein, partial [Candidatus Poribacteria bacterium]|nr:right-handed parallel beta-helix repeat-containing protein [Candidatus Poribacteria bacterium]